MASTDSVRAPGAPLTLLKAQNRQAVDAHVGEIDMHVVDVVGVFAVAGQTDVHGGGAQVVQGGGQSQDQGLVRADAGFGAGLVQEGGYVAAGDGCRCIHGFGAVEISGWQAL